jgi:hypothetical protein
MPPQVGAEGTINLETKPRQVKAWLDQLPLAEPVTSALELLKFLAACNRGDLADDRRQQVLDLLEPVLAKVLASLRTLYLPASQPLDARTQSLADMAGALLTEVAETYRLLIQSQLEPRFRLFGNDPLPALLRGRIGHLRQLLIHHYETLAAVPTGLWLDLHSTYSLALKFGHADERPEQGGATTTDLYRGVLLLAVADPYRMPGHELPWALDLIDRQGALAQLIPSTALRSRPGTFAVDHRADAPPYPLARDVEPLLQAWTLTLNTTEPVKFLTWLINFLSDPDAVKANDLDPVLRDSRYPAFLHRLKRQWSAAQQRLAARRPTERPLDHQICTGFANLLACLAKSDEGTSTPADAGLATCQATNLSAGGMTLAKEGLLDIPIEVGALVGVRSSPQAPWQIGVVRWLRAPQQGELAFGVQLLAPHAQVAELQPPKDTSKKQALLLSTQHGVPEAGMLIAEPGALSEGTSASIRLGDQVRKIELEKRVDILPGLASYRVRLTEA